MAGFSFGKTRQHAVITRQLRQKISPAIAVQVIANQRPRIPRWGAEDGTFYSYYAYVRELVDGKRLKAERPEVAVEYLKESVYRTPYRKSPKKGKK